MTVRPLLKRILPAPASGIAGRALTYWYRVRTWRAVMTELRGATAADQAILRRSFRQGLIAAFRSLREWQNPELVANATIAVPGVGEFEVRAFSDDLYQLLPSQEAGVRSEIRRRLKAGSTFVDAGANIGACTVLASRLVGPEGKVFAIEMMPDTADRLRRHIEGNQLHNVTVFECALSDQGGKSITAFVTGAEYGQASIVRRARDQRGRTLKVITETLDKLLGDVPGPIDLIKIDIEGAEASALAGATEVLSRTKAVIFEQLEGEAPAGDLLEAAGFRIRSLDPRNRVAERP